MFHTNRKKEVCTLPNLLSILRLAMIPVYVHVYSNAETPEDYLLAASIMGVSCLTDLADGWIARRFHQITNLGKVLDPLADKITQLTLMLCLVGRYPVLRPVVALLVVKELLQLGMGILFLRKGKMLSGALPAGKLSSAVLFVSLIALAAMPHAPAALVEILCLGNGFLLTASFLSYALAYFGPEAGLQDIRE